MRPSHWRKYSHRLCPLLGRREQAAGRPGNLRRPPCVHPKVGRRTFPPHFFPPVPLPTHARYLRRVSRPLFCRRLPFWFRFSPLLAHLFFAPNQVRVRFRLGTDPTAPPFASVAVPASITMADVVRPMIAALELPACSVRYLGRNLPVRGTIPTRGCSCIPFFSTAPSEPAGVRIHSYLPSIPCPQGEVNLADLRLPEDVVLDILGSRANTPTPPSTEAASRLIRVVLFFEVRSGTCQARRSSMVEG